MASTPFTLAALATSAVPGLRVTGTRPHTSGSGGAYTSAVLETDQGEVIARVPAEPAAEVQQSAEMLALAALVEGARSRLPFAAPTTLGMTRAGDTRAVVSTFIPGTALSLDNVESDPELLQRIVAAISALHDLPSGLARDGGLPVRNAEEVRAAAERLVQRAADTGMLPATVRQRWNTVLDAEVVWSFEPTVVHGALAPELFLLDETGGLGLLGWSELSLGDPAADLGWLLNGDRELFTAALAHYAASRGISGSQELVTRARFFHELEVAKWLLHGFEAHDQEIVDDAVTMLDNLVDRLGLIGPGTSARRVLSEGEVERMLDETPAVDFDPRSETAEFESLDEDRAFALERDFFEAKPVNEAAAEPSDAAPTDDAQLDEDDRETGVIDPEITDGLSSRKRLD